MTEFTIEISNVLNYLIHQRGISEAALGRKIGVPRATINRLVSGKTPDPRASTLEAIADFFGISIDQLLGKRPLIGMSQENNSLNTNADHSIPVLAWPNANQWREMLETIKPDTHFDWILTDPTIDGGRFALVFQGESMWPPFSENTLLIIDPEKTPKNRDFVIVCLGDNQEILFRQLIIDGTYQFLKPINTIYPTMRLKESDKFIGVVVQSRNKLG